MGLPGPCVNLVTCVFYLIKRNNNNNRKAINMKLVMSLVKVQA